MTKPYVVCKFGGTSVATPEGRAAMLDQVKAHLNAGVRPVVVVSAMGRRDDPYATDTLLDLVADMPSDKRELDKLVSIGEDISSILIAHEFRAAGVPAHAFSGPEAGIVTDDTAGNARILSVCPAALIDAAEEGTVPIVAGFQGISTNGYITTLGRGGSDTTACALGVALDAQAVEIYSDVDGVMTADPRDIPDAQVIDTLHPDELFQLCRMGSRIVHTPAAELALESGANLLVKNTYSEHPGTKVCDIDAYRGGSDSGKVATAITVKTDITRFKVNLTSGTSGNNDTCAHITNQSAVYSAIAQTGVSLDMFTPSDEHLYFTVQTADAPLVRESLSALCTQICCDYTDTSGFAKVTVVGAGMHGVPGVMARIAHALNAMNIDIKQTADSHTTISVLIDETQATQAQEALHAAFKLDYPVTVASGPESQSNKPD